MSILNDSKTDPNKMLPMEYPWAWELYQSGVANNWTPSEIPMMDDIELWKSDNLSADERRIVLYNLGFFSTAESLTANNIVLAIYKFVHPNVRMYLLRQAFEEAIHTHMLCYCCDSLGLNPDEIYNMYKNVPSIKKKDDFIVGLTISVLDKDFEPIGTDNIKKFIYDIFSFYILFEGMSFYAGFAMMLAMRRNKKLIGLGQQFEYTARDESLHVLCGINLINTIKKEYPGVWDKDFQDHLIYLSEQIVNLEAQYSADACPNGVLGMKHENFTDYVKYTADRRLVSLGLPRIYNTENPFPWLSVSFDLSKEQNFFETKVTEYRSGGLVWND